jgi:hypothetical protein
MIELGKYFSWLGSFFESAFKEGWIWYLVGALAILIILMLIGKINMDTTAIFNK